MTEEICELLWMKQVQEDLKMKCDGHMKLFCDNKLTISIAHNLVQHDTIKHIQIDIHSIKEKFNNVLITTTYISSRHQPEDGLVKSL
jgi:hypothetical protein